jgi:hypothetical protein
MANDVDFHDRDYDDDGDPQQKPKKKGFNPPGEKDDDDACKCHYDSVKCKRFCGGLCLSLHRTASSAVFALLMWFTLPYLRGTLNVSYWSACGAWAIYPISEFLFTFLCGLAKSEPFWCFLLIVLPLLLAGSIAVLGTLPELATLLPWLAVPETGDENLALEGVVMGLVGLAAFLCAGYQTVYERIIFLNRKYYMRHFPELLEDVSLFLGRCIALVAFIFSYLIFPDQYRWIMFVIVSSWVMLASIVNFIVFLVSLSMAESIHSSHISEPKTFDSCTQFGELCRQLRMFFHSGSSGLVWIFFFFFVMAFYSFMPLATEWFALAEYSWKLDSSYEDDIFVMALIFLIGTGGCAVLYYVNMDGCCRSNDAEDCNIGPRTPLVTWIFIGLFTFALAGCSFMLLFDVDEIGLKLGLSQFEIDEWGLKLCLGAMVVGEAVVSTRFFRLLVYSVYQLPETLLNPSPERVDSATHISVSFE